MVLLRVLTFSMAVYTIRQPCWEPRFFFCSITAKCFLDVREGLAALLIMIVLTELSLMSLLAFSSGVIMNKSLESAMCLAQSACTSTLRVCVTGLIIIRLNSVSGSIYILHTCIQTLGMDDGDRLLGHVL